MTGGSWSGFISVNGAVPGPVGSYFLSVSRQWRAMMEIPLLLGRDRLPDSLNLTVGAVKTNGPRANATSVMAPANRQAGSARRRKLATRIQPDHGAGAKTRFAAPRRSAASGSESRDAADSRLSRHRILVAVDGCRDGTHSGATRIDVAPAVNVRTPNLSRRAKHGIGRRARLPAAIVAACSRAIRA